MDHEFEERLSRIEAQLDKLVAIVEGLLGGIAAAQSSGGMAGMMAKQLPDAATILQMGN